VDISTVTTTSGNLYTNVALNFELSTTARDLDGELQDGNDVVDKIMHIKDKILDHMQELVVFCLTLDGNLLVKNKAAQYLLGDTTPVVGQGIEWLFQRWEAWEMDFSRKLPFEEWGIHRLLTKGEVVRQTFGCYSPDGSPKVLELGGEPIKDDDGKTIAGSAFPWSL